MGADTYCPHCFDSSPVTCPYPGTGHSYCDYPNRLSVNATSRLIHIKRLQKQEFVLDVFRELE